MGDIASKNEYAKDVFLLEVDPDKLTRLINDISPYTDVINEDIDQLQTEIALKRDNGYLAKNSLVITEASKLETEYLVQRGDTISGIAKKFNMHVATILDRNSIKVDQIEGIHPGQKLIIPPKDTSDSQNWLVELNNIKEKQRQKALAEQAKKQKLALSKRSTVYRDSSPYRGQSDGSWSRPISYSYISRGILRGHSGIDMVANSGTPVYAAKSGKIVGSTGGYGSGYGLSLVLDHGNGQTSRYAHLSRFAAGLGDVVSQGQLIGYSGNTGWSTGPHLHFEARQNGSVFDPW